MLSAIERKSFSQSDGTEKEHAAEGELGSERCLCVWMCGNGGSGVITTLVKAFQVHYALWPRSFSFLKLCLAEIIRT